MRSQWVVMVTVALLALPVLAKKPDDAGKNKGHSAAAAHAGGSNAAQGPVPAYGLADVYFTDPRASLIRSYYARNGGLSSCPPGLAKKANGCQPPGLAKKWQRGHALPRDVYYEDLPVALLRELGRTPEGQKLIRVGGDILLINAATRLVIDAFEGG